LVKALSRIYLNTLGVQADGVGTPGLGAVHTWLGGLLVLAAVPILIAVNLITLMFGVRVALLGHNGVKFIFLRLWGPVRAIYVMLPVMIGYGIWHKLQTIGLLELFVSAAATIIAAGAITASILLFNRLRATP
jgi:hypothetical protein